MRQKILVVDDEEGIIFLLKDYLELQGYEVITAGGGVEALEKKSLYCRCSITCRHGSVWLCGWSLRQCCSTANE